MAETLVLGANGFVGSHLVDSLVEGGHNVRAFDRFGSPARFVEHENIEIRAGDYMNTGDLEDALKDIEYVFHFISTTTPAASDKDPTIDIETNLRMSVELFKLCADSDVKRVIFASTGGAIYGNGGEGEARKETDSAEPVSPYAIGKLAIENYLRYFRSKHRLQSTSFRISNPYGERQPTHRRQGVIPIFLDNLYHDRPLTVNGDGGMVRDYIYVKDLANMIARVFERGDLKDLYNVGSGQGTTLNDIIEMAAHVSGKTPVVERAPVPSTFINSVVLDMKRFIADFGEYPLTSLEDGMRATYNYIVQQNTQGEGT